MPQNFPKTIFSYQYHIFVPVNEIRREPLRSVRMDTDAIPPVSTHVGGALPRRLSLRRIRRTTIASDLLLVGGGLRCPTQCRASRRSARSDLSNGSGPQARPPCLICSLRIVVPPYSGRKPSAGPGSEHRDQAPAQSYRMLKKRLWKSPGN